MTPSMDGILTILKDKNITVENLIEAINESVDPRKPVICLMHCTGCGIDFITSHIRLKNVRKRNTPLLCLSCKKKHDQLNGTLRVNRFRERKSTGILKDKSECIKALAAAKKEKGKLTAELYCEWQVDNPDAPTKGDIERTFGSWKQAKKTADEYEKIPTKI